MQLLLQARLQAHGAPALPDDGVAQVGHDDVLRLAVGARHHARLLHQGEDQRGARTHRALQRMRRRRQGVGGGSVGQGRRLSAAEAPPRNAPLLSSRARPTEGRGTWRRAPRARAACG